MAETRWLDAHEQEVWRAFLAAIRLLDTQLDRELQRDGRIPHGYYEILVILSESPERTIRMSELAELSQSSRSRLSHAIARMEEAGWVARRSCPSDRRGSFATLTEKGFAALEFAAPIHVEGVRHHLFDRLSAEQVDQLGEISTAVRDGLVGLGTLPCPGDASDD